MHCLHLRKRSPCLSLTFTWSVVVLCQLADNMKPCMWSAGAADGSVKVWDTRHLKDAVHTFKLHDSAIMRVEWAPYKKGVLGTGFFPIALTA